MGVNLCSVRENQTGKKRNHGLIHLSRHKAGRDPSGILPKSWALDRRNRDSDKSRQTIRSLWKSKGRIRVRSSFHMIRISVESLC